MVIVAPERHHVPSTHTAGAPRYSLVRGVRPGPHGGSCLVLETPARELVELDLACAPGSTDDLPVAGLRPLAVRIGVDDDAVDGVPRCSALCTSSDGPRRVAISLGAALALCAEGCHTIVTSVGRS